MMMNTTNIASVITETVTVESNFFQPKVRIRGIDEARQHARIYKYILHSLVRIFMDGMRNNTFIAVDAHILTYSREILGVMEAIAQHLYAVPSTNL
jgi:hypothetical protein